MVLNFHLFFHHILEKKKHVRWTQWNKLEIEKSYILIKYQKSYFHHNGYPISPYVYFSIINPKVSVLCCCWSIDVRVEWMYEFVWKIVHSGKATHCIYFGNSDLLNETNKCFPDEEKRRGRFGFDSKISSIFTRFHRTDGIAECFIQCCDFPMLFSSGKFTIFEHIFTHSRIYAHRLLLFANNTNASGIKCIRTHACKHYVWTNAK